MQTGMGVFLEGLRGLGFAPTSVAGRPDHVVIDYEVETGKFAGTKLRLGFIVPPDFPVTPPSGIHVAALIHPFKGDGQHPTRQAISASMRCWLASTKGRVSAGFIPRARRVVHDKSRIQKSRTARS
jgi:hypothetical protein